MSPQLLDNQEQIRRLVSERVETERAQYESSDTGKNGPSQFKAEAILKALDSNEDGDAEL